ncbi:MAG: radical SAM/SPASM domain-containing protein [Candidatus Aenigmatarchaeota archaeon]
MLRKGYPVTNVYLFKNKLWLEEFSTRMHEWLEGKKRPPIKIDAELHRRCNLNCRFCSRRENEKDMTEESKNIEVQEERWLEIAEQSGKMGVKGWNISGIGEPMCKPEFTLSVMEKLKNYDVFGEMTTNGTLWTEDMVKRTVEMGWDSVCVSLDSPDKETHNWLRRSDAYDRAVKTISLFKKWKERLGKEVPSITINAVLNKKNYKQMPKLFLLGKDLGVDSIFVEPMIVYTKQGEKLKLDEDEIKEFKEIAEKCESIAKKYGIEPNINCFDEDKEYEEELVNKTSEMKEVIEDDKEEGVENFKDPDREYSEITNKILNIPCYYPWFYMIITADGSASHCGEKVNKDVNIKNQDLEEIWYSKDFKEDRRKFLEGDLPDYCNRCRPNVVGDARRIRKSIIELRDRQYLENAIYEAEIINENLRDKIEVLKSCNKEDFTGCDNNCRHEKKLEDIKSGVPYKVSKKITDTSLGKKVKKVINSKVRDESIGRGETTQGERKTDELRKELWEKIKENKRIKDKIYDIREDKKIYQEMKEICQAKVELEELEDSLSSKI